MFQKIATVAVSTMMLSACVVAVGHDRDWDDDHPRAVHISVDDSDSGRNGTSIRLESGARVTLKCAKGFEVHIEESDDKVTSYGCRAKDDEA